MGDIIIFPTENLQNMSSLFLKLLHQEIKDNYVGSIFLFFFFLLGQARCYVWGIAKQIPLWIRWCRMHEIWRIFHVIRSPNISATIIRKLERGGKKKIFVHTFISVKINPMWSWQVHRLHGNIFSRTMLVIWSCAANISA